ncbi:MAG: UbiA family prenyltransferase, partial [Acidobacteria bacterium]|nr:UbiA family prenyltransferase [Acidobacteriota bacterium]
MARVLSATSIAAQAVQAPAAAVQAAPAGPAAPAGSTAPFVTLAPAIAAPGAVGGAVALGDLAAMTKPGITLMVALTSALGFLLAGGAVVSWQLAAALLGTCLVAAGASVLNQFWERSTDALMRRTAGRPLPAGRLDPDVALLFGVALAVAGLLELALAVNALTAALGAVALAGYVFVYTPLKKVSS